VTNSNGEKDIDPSGQPPAKGRPSRRRGGRRVWPLGKSTGIAFLVGALAVAICTVVAAWRIQATLTDLEAGLHAQQVDQLRLRIARRAATSETRLRQLAFSDTLYADLGRLELEPDLADSGYRPSQLESLIEAEGARFVGLYTIKGQSLFRWKRPGTDGVELTTNSVFRLLDNGEPAAGLMWQGGRLLWVAGAPVLPSAGGRAGPIGGYLIALRPVVGGDLAAEPGPADATIDLEEQPANREPVATTVDAYAGGDSIRAQVQLTDIFAGRTVLASIRSDRQSFRSAEHGFRLVLVIAMLAIVGLAAGGWWLTHRSLVQPVHRVAEALEPLQAGLTPSILAPPSSAPEWQVAAAAMNRMISHVRTAQERQERLFGAARDGVWELDLSTGAWTLSQRASELLGQVPRGPHESLRLDDLAVAEHRKTLASAIERSAAESVPLHAEVELEIPGGPRRWFRIEGRAVAGPHGRAGSLVGRLIALDEEHATRDAIDAMRTSLADAWRRHGRTLQEIAHRAETAGFSEDLEFIGRGWAEEVAADGAGPFDLHTLLQELAEESTPAASVSVAPGVAARVIGDREMVRRALRPLVANASRAGGSVELRAERGNDSGPDAVRLVVRSEARDVDEAARSRMASLLGEGVEPADKEVGAIALGLRVVHRAVTTLGGSAGVDLLADDQLSVWIALDLPPAPEVAVVDPIAELEAEIDWTDPTVVARCAKDVRISGSQFRPAVAEPTVELVADASVTIDFDDRPATADSDRLVNAAFAAQLVPGPNRSPLALQMARSFLADAPDRLMELREAANEGEITTARSLTESLGGMAGMIGADRLVQSCSGVLLALDAGEPADLERALSGISQSLGDVVVTLRALVPATDAERPADRPPIDAAILDQLRASVASDGGGMGGQLISLFLAEGPLRIAGLERAVATDDRSALTVTANDLRGMAALVGASGLASLCASPPGTDPSGWVQAIADELSRAVRVLESVIDAPAPA